MIKLGSIVILLLCFGFGSISAQESGSSVNVSVAATVQDYLDMVNLANIDVGTVISGEETLILHPQTDQGAGIIMVHGRENASIQVGYSAQVEMVNLATRSTLIVNYSVSGNSENEQSSSSMFVSNPETITLNSGGEYYLYIGCSFDLLNLVSGQYDGDFVIEVDYN